MASNDWLAALLGGSVAVVPTRMPSSPSREFRDRLAEQMVARGLGTLVFAEPGRNDQGLFWALTINHPAKGVSAVVVRLGDLEPYSNAAMDFVVERVVRWATR